MKTLKPHIPFWPTPFSYLLFSPSSSLPPFSSSSSRPAHRDAASPPPRCSLPLRCTDNHSLPLALAPPHLLSSHHPAHHRRSSAAHFCSLFPSHCNRFTTPIFFIGIKKTGEFIPFDSYTCSFWEFGPVWLNWVVWALFAILSGLVSYTSFIYHELHFLSLHYWLSYGSCAPRERARFGENEMFRKPTCKGKV